MLALVIVLVSAGGDAFEYELLPDGTAKITKYSGEDTKLVVPERLDDHRVTAIGDRSFYECASLREVTIPAGVTSIGDYAFHGCTSLTDIKIPDSVTSIGDEAFDSRTLLVVARNFYAKERTISNE